MAASSVTPDYEKLRQILERRLGHAVTLEYAIKVGTSLINIYDTLLYSGDTADGRDTLPADSNICTEEQ